MVMKPSFPWRAFALFLLVSGVVLGTFLLWGDAIDEWTKSAVARAGENRALVAWILFVVLSSDILLPVPSSLASTLCGLLLGPWLGFAVSFGAMSASGVLGYAAVSLVYVLVERVLMPDDGEMLDVHTADTCLAVRNAL